MSRYQTELPASIASRSKPHLTLEELCKLMKWKLTVRPRFCVSTEEKTILVLEGKVQAEADRDGAAEQL